MKNKINVKHSNFLVKKNRKFIYEAKYQIGVNSMKYLSALICMIRSDDTKFFDYTTSAKELVEILGMEINLKSLAKIADELTDFKLHTEKNGEGMYAPVFEYIKYNSNTYTLNAKFGVGAIPYLLELDNNYLKYGLANILKLKSTNIIRLYEMCRNKLEQKKIKGNRAELEIDIKELRELFEIPKSYQNSQLKSRIFNPAILQFKEHTDIEISYSELKTGRMITGFIVYIKRQEKPSKFSPMLKFKEVFLKAITNAYKWDDDEICEERVYSIGEYHVMEDSQLLADEHFRILAKEDAQSAWEDIFNNVDTLLNTEWVESNNHKWRVK